MGAPHDSILDQDNTSEGIPQLLTWLCNRQDYFDTQGLLTGSYD